MMSFTRMIPLAVLALILLSPRWVFALGSEKFGNKELSDANYTSWPGIMPVINSPARVYLVWVNGHESFDFKGTSAQLNETLQHFARIQGVTKHEVILHVGPGQGASSFNPEKKFSFDWELEIMAGISAHMFKLDQGDKVWSKDPILKIYVSDSFPLNEISIPAGVTLVSPTELSQRIIEGISASNDQTVRGWGCGNLAHVSPYDERNLAVIASFLPDKIEWVQVNATSAVARFGKLRELAKSDDENVKRSSEKAIQTIEAATDTSEAEEKHTAVLEQIDKFIAEQREKAEIQ